MKGVTIRPAKLNLAGLIKGVSPLGVRGAASINIQDHRDGDSLSDPYVASRSYDPMTRGTSWGKWLARHRDWQDLEVDVLTGDLSQNLEDMRRQTFFLEDVAGPSASGAVSISVRDILSRADGGKSLAPRATDGTLDVGINASATSLVVELRGSVPDLTLYAQMGLSDTGGLLRIGNEIIRYSGRTDNSPTAGKVTFSSLQRGGYLWALGGGSMVLAAEPV